MAACCCCSDVIGDIGMVTGFGRMGGGGPGAEADDILLSNADDSIPTLLPLDAW